MWTWERALLQFEQSHWCSAVQQNLRDFISEQKSDESKQEVLLLWVKCVARWTVQGQLDRNLYDARHFWMDRNHVARTVCGYVDRCVLAEAQKGPGGLSYFTTPEFLEAISSMGGNRATQGFLVERSVLAFLQRIQVMNTALAGTYVAKNRINTVLFPGVAPFTTQLTLSDDVTLYVPDLPNYKAVDAVIRVVDSSRLPQPEAQGARSTPRKKPKVEESQPAPPAPKVKVTVIGVQVTLAKVDEDKKARTNLFFAHSRRWVGDVHGIPGYDIDWQLLYVMDTKEHRSNPPASTVTYGNITASVKSVGLDQIDAQLNYTVETSGDYQ